MGAQPEIVSVVPPPDDASCLRRFVTAADISQKLLSSLALFGRYRSFPHEMMILTANSLNNAREHVSLA